MTENASYDWMVVRAQATTLALARLNELSIERAIRMAQYVARYPEAAPAWTCPSCGKKVRGATCPLCRVKRP